MTDEELIKEIKTLRSTFPDGKWEPKNWIIDGHTFMVIRKIGYANGMVNLDYRTRETVLLGLPVHIAHEPIRPMPPKDFVLPDHTTNDFFVLSIEGRGDRTGRTYYHDSEKCVDLIVAERNNTLLVKVS